MISSDNNAKKLMLPPELPPVDGGVGAWVGAALTVTVRVPVAVLDPSLIV